jgi:hypothetical protein
LFRIHVKRLALIPLLVLMAVSAAAAQQDGVFVDPDSPAGKEYAVPLDQARDEASGGAEGAPGDRLLFGEGIEPAEGKSAGAQGGNGAGKAGGASGDAGGGAPEGDGGPSPLDVGQSSVAIEAAAADGSNGLLSAGIAAAVLAVGLLGGLGLRKLFRSG